MPCAIEQLGRYKKAWTGVIANVGSCCKRGRSFEALMLRCEAPWLANNVRADQGASHRREASPIGHHHERYLSLAGIPVFNAHLPKRVSKLVRCHVSHSSDRCVRPINNSQYRLALRANCIAISLSRSALLGRSSFVVGCL